MLQILLSEPLPPDERQPKSRAAIVEKRQCEGMVLADLKEERATLKAKGKQIETEAVPIPYVAQFLGIDADRERAQIRWLLTLIVASCDPLAIALTAAV